MIGNTIDKYTREVSEKVRMAMKIYVKNEHKQLQFLLYRHSYNGANKSICDFDIDQKQ